MKEFCYITEDDLEQFIKRTICNNKLTRICEKLGIPPRSTHKIRKTYGTTLIDNNVDDSIVAELMGHVDISTTRKIYYYSNKSRANKKKQVRAALQGI